MASSTISEGFWPISYLSSPDQIPLPSAHHAGIASSTEPPCEEVSSLSPHLPYEEQYLQILRTSFHANSVPGAVWQWAYDVDTAEFVPIQEEYEVLDFPTAPYSLVEVDTTSSQENTQSNGTSKLNPTAVEFLPRTQEHLIVTQGPCGLGAKEQHVAVLTEPSAAESVDPVTDAPPLSVLDPLTGNFIPVSPRPSPFNFEANDDFDAEYAFNVSRVSSNWQEEQEQGSLYTCGFYFPTIDNRDDAVPEVFCPIRCLERFPVATPLYSEVPAQSTQSNRQQFLHSWFEEWPQYEEYSVAEMAGVCIHHFNFFNQPVYEKSATKPATTIAVLKSSSKHFAKTDSSTRDLRIPTTVFWASRFLDPVRYTGDPAILDTLRGTELENAVIGRCDKFYTGNGWWLYDEWSPEEEQPFLDTLSTDKYIKGHTIINGCTEGFPTSREIISAGTEEKLAVDKARKEALQSRMARGATKSRLGQSCVSCDDLEEEVPIFGRPRAQGTSGDQQGADVRHKAPPAAASTAVPSPMSREEFHRRLAAIPLPSGGDWDEDEEEYEKEQVDELLTPSKAPTSERDAWNRRLDAFGPIGSANWADDLDDEEEDYSASSAPAGAPDMVLLKCTTPEPASLPMVASPTTPKTVLNSTQQTAPESPEMKASDEQPSTPSQAPSLDHEEFARRLEALGPLGSTNWADDIDDEEDVQVSSPVSAASTASESTLPTSRATSASNTASSATSVASTDDDEPKSPESPEVNPADDDDDEEDIIGTVIEPNVASWDCDIDRNELPWQPARDEMEDETTEEMEPELAEEIAEEQEGMPASIRTLLLEAMSEPISKPISPAQVEPESLAREPAEGPSGHFSQRSPQSALESLCWQAVKAAAYSPAFGGGYDQWPEFVGITESEFSALALPPSTALSKKSSPAEEIPMRKSKGWVKKGIGKFRSLFTRKI